MLIIPTNSLYWNVLSHFIIICMQHMYYCGACMLANKIQNQRHSIHTSIVQTACMSRIYDVV